MARTRSRPTKSTAKESTPEPPPSTIKPLPASTQNPPKLFVLPKDTSKYARIVTLDNPANGKPSRYYFCPQKGFYEFTRIAAPKKDCRSWLLTGEEKDDENTEKEEGVRIGSGYTTSSADLFIATPIDILFLILHALLPKNAKETKQHFLAFDDYLDTLSSSSRHWKALILQYPTLSPMIEKKMPLVCDTVDAGDETMYRISHDKLLAILMKKAERMIKYGLPPSLEEKFIKSALDVPIMSIKRDDSTLSGISTDDTIPTDDTATEQDSQLSTSTAPTSQSTTATTTPPLSTVTLPSEPALHTPPTIPHLLRLSTTLRYLTLTYLSPSLHPALTLLTAPLFIPLTTHLAALATLKAEAAALRSISDNVSRKRAVEEDDDKIAEREEKKRKKEDEERKKKVEGRGVKMLKKVDTTGMRKMSSFFGKVEKKV